MPLSLPPRDESGSVVPHDHAQIATGDGAIRKISEHLIVPEADGRLRISSMAFKPSSGPNGGMSVDIESSIRGAGLIPEQFVTTPRWIGSVRLEVGEVRGGGLMVGYDPRPENPHHGQIWGGFSRSQQRLLQRIATWFVPIPDVDVV